MSSHPTRQLLEQALCHHRAGRLKEAHAIYSQLLAAAPADADVMHLAGTLAFQMGDHAEAMTLIGQAISLEPQAGEFHAALGQVQFANGKVDPAIASYRRALALRHEMPDVHYNLGSALLMKGEFEAAAASLQTSIALRPNFADAFNNLGATFRALGKLDEAAGCYQHVITLEPTHAKAFVNLAQILKMIGQIDAAITCFDRAIALGPSIPEARSGKIYTLHYHPGCNAVQLLCENLLWNQWHAKPLRNIRRGHPNDRNADRKLRVGYVSPDFRDHVAGLYLLPLLEKHDRDTFEIFAYSNVIRPDAITGRFRACCDGWRDIAAVSDEGAEQLIRDDRIDILVDTTMHMGGNRLPLFARKPAPIQATFCAYPGTTGLETMDYRLTDPYLDPSDGGDSQYSEQSIRLPETFWCYQPLQDVPMATTPPCRTNGHLTFGCLNNFCKTNAAVIALWAKVLNAITNSRLMLLAPRGSARSQPLEIFGKEGIDATRIEFIDFRPRRQYLETYRRIDIALDTFPYNGHTTSLDALWMGVPVVTIVGQTAVGRAGWSQLSNLGLPELAAQDENQFVDTVVKLATDPTRLADLHATLRQRMEQSCLMDASRFARRVEDAYRQMWEQSLGRRVGR